VIHERDAQGIFSIVVSRYSLRWPRPWLRLPPLRPLASLTREHPAQQVRKALLARIDIVELPPVEVIRVLPHDLSEGLKMNLKRHLIHHEIKIC
jgi:hypothetical protein